MLPVLARSSNSVYSPSRARGTLRPHWPMAASSSPVGATTPELLSPPQKSLIPRTKRRPPSAYLIPPASITRRRCWPMAESLSPVALARAGHSPPLKFLTRQTLVPVFEYSLPRWAPRARDTPLPDSIMGHCSSPAVTRPAPPRYLIRRPKHFPRRYWPWLRRDLVIPQLYFPMTAFCSPAVTPTRWNISRRLIRRSRSIRRS